MQDLVIIGAGGNTRVILDMIALGGRYRAVGLLDDNPAREGEVMMGVPILGPRAKLRELWGDGLRLAVVGVGAAKSTALRRQICEEVRELGFELPNIVHPSAIVARSVELGSGLLVMAGVILNPCARVEDDVLLNTGSLVEHDCALERGAFLAPGVKLAGGTRVGRGAFVGVGAISIQGVQIGEESLVAAGAVLTKDVPPRHFARGVPAVIRPLAG